jgi:hypothetical protein
LMLFSIGAGFPAKSEVSCVSKVTGAPNPPAQADDNFACLKDAIVALQKENDRLSSLLKATPRLEAGNCSYVGHDLWTCSASCANAWKAVGGWCGDVNTTDLTPEDPHIEGSDKFVCGLRQKTVNAMKSQVSISAFCLP